MRPEVVVGQNTCRVVQIMLSKEVLLEIFAGKSVKLCLQLDTIAVEEAIRGQEGGDFGGRPC